MLAAWANCTVASEFLGEFADRFKLSKATVDVLAAETFDKVLPTMWLVANTRILKTLMKVDINFNVLQYLAYTEMIGELACRFTRSSVLLLSLIHI